MQKEIIELTKDLLLFEEIMNREVPASDKEKLFKVFEEICKRKAAIRGDISAEISLNYLISKYL